MVKLPDLYSQSRVGSAVSPPRAQTVSPQEASQGTRALQDASEQWTKLADNERKAYVQAKAMELDAELDNELFELEKKAKTSTNPEAIEQEFEARAAVAKKKYLEWLPDREMARRLEGRYEQKIGSARRGIFNRTSDLRKKRTVADYETGVRKSFQNIGDEDFPEDRIPQVIMEQNENLRVACEGGAINATDCAQIEHKYIRDAIKVWNARKGLRDSDAQRTFLENYQKAKKSGALDAYSTRTADLTGKLTSGKSRRPAYGWARTNKTWQGLNPYEKAAAMSLMEANAMRIGDAKNVLGAMINRAANEGDDLGAHVSGQIYQPTWEKNQEARLDKILRSKEYKELVGWAQKRAAGEIPDPVNGATHFLAHEKTMLELERQNPKKYRSWRKWTGFNPNTKSYEGVITRDGSHAFLAPEGKFNGVVGTPGPAGPEDAQNLIPLPPDMVIGHQLLQHLSDVEVQELLDSVKTQQRSKNLEKYAEDTESLNGAIDRIRKGGELTPEDKAQLKEIEARWKGLGAQYEQRFNRFSIDIEEAQHYRGALNGKDTINKDISLDGMTAEEMNEHFDTLRKRAAKGKLRDQAIQSRAIDDAVREAKDVLEKRAKDPAASVLKIPAVQEADEDLKQIEGQIVQAEGAFDEARLRLLRRQQIEARLAAQEEVGIPTPVALTKEEARRDYPFVKGQGTEAELHDRAREYYKKALDRYGDPAVAAQVVQNAYDLQVQRAGDRRTEVESGIKRESLEPMTMKDIRQLNRVERDAAQYDPQGRRGAPPARPFPSEEKQKHLRENAGNQALVNSYRRIYGDDVTLDILYGRKIEPPPKPTVSDAGARPAAESTSGAFAEDNAFGGWTPHGALRDLFTGGGDRVTGEDVAKKRAMSNPYRLPQE